MIHHNGPPARCVGQPHRRCEDFWANVGTFHAGKFGDAWARSLYSFGICPHGILFVGQGWDRRQAANGRDVVGTDDGIDAEWYTVLAFHGGGAYAGFDTGSPEEPVTDDMRDAIRRLIHEGRTSGRCQNRVLSHNQFKPKACPAQTLTAFARELDTNPTLSEENMEFTRPEAFLYATASYLEIAGRDPEPGAADAWADVIVADARNMFRLQSLLTKEQRERTAARLAKIAAGLASVDAELDGVSLDGPEEAEVRRIVAEGLQAAVAVFGAAATG